MTNPPPLHPRVLAALQGGNGQMVKRALQYRGLKRGAGDDIDELANRIEKYVAEGKLSAAAVEHMLREMHEYGAKHVYVLRGDRAKMRGVDRATLDRLVPSLDDARVTLRPSAPRCNYSFADGRCIRISYSEIHTRPRLVRDGRGWGASTSQSNRVITIHADLQSGIALLAMDPPGGDHDHGDRASDYVDYYHVLAAQLLDTALVPLQWHDQLAAIEDDAHKDVVAVSTQRGQDDQGLDYTLGCGKADLRDYDGFTSRQGNIVLRRSVKVTWQKTPGVPTAAMLTNGEALLKPVTTEIFAAPAMIKFAQHTLPQEMTYVLDFVWRLA